MKSVQYDQPSLVETWEKSLFGRAMAKKKYREYPKEHHIQSFLTIYTNSCKLYRSLEWKVDLTFKNIEERENILKSCHMLPTWHVTSTNSHNVPQSCLKVVSKYSRCFADVVPKLSFSYVKVAQKMFLSCFKVVLEFCQSCPPVLVSTWRRLDRVDKKWDISWILETDHLSKWSCRCILRGILDLIY